MASFASPFATPTTAGLYGNTGPLSVQGGYNPQTANPTTAGLYGASQPLSVNGAVPVHYSSPAGPPAPNPFSQTYAASVPSTAVIPPPPTFSQVYNGKVYTDPNQLAQAQAANSFGTKVYNGQSYTDPTAYSNAVIADAQTQHDQSVKQINQAYQDGLINFSTQQSLIDQSRQGLQSQASDLLTNYGEATKALSDSRDADLSSQRGYFNSVSPDAVQSQQQVLAGKTNDAYNQNLADTNTKNQENQTSLANANTSLDAQQAALTTQQSRLPGSYQDSLNSANQAFQGAQDQARQAVLNQGQTVQGILDAGQNAAASFKNQLANYGASAAKASAPTVTQFDPVSLASSMAGFLVNAQQVGQNPQQSLADLRGHLSSQGFNAAQIAPLINYAYGQVFPSNGQSTVYGNKDLVNQLGSVPAQ